jgi:hypothetical protein
MDNKYANLPGIVIVFFILTLKKIIEQNVYYL